MEFIGKITVCCERRSGNSNGKDWASQDFVAETENERFPKKILFGVFGDDKLKQFNLKVGDRVKILYDTDAHEYNGRWFGENKAYQVERIS